MADRALLAAAVSPAAVVRVVAFGHAAHDSALASIPCSVEVAAVQQNRRHLEHVPRVYVDHYNTQRPHRSLKLIPPDPPDPPPEDSEGDIRRRDRLGGLIHKYYREAA